MLDKKRQRLIREFSSHVYEAASLAPKSARIPYAAVTFDKNEVENAVTLLYDMFVTRWFALGKNALRFQQRFSSLLGLAHTLITNSGSSANLLAIAALAHLRRLRPGDEVLTPAVNFPTAINPLLLYGLRPVLVDVDLPSYTLSARRLKEAASKKTKGILLPHLNGSASYMPEIVELAAKRGWSVVEDCCDALGTKVDQRYAGTFGDISTFSFYAAHHLCMGEGGAIATNDKDLFTTLLSLRDWGRATDEELFDMRKGRTMRTLGRNLTMPEDYETRYTYVTRGFNLKPLDLQPAIGLAQLDKLEHFRKRRRENFEVLRDGLAKYESRLVLPEALSGVDPSWFVFPVVVRGDAGFSRKAIVEFLEKRGIETRPILAGNILVQPAYLDAGFRVPSKLKNSDFILKSGFFFGVHPALTGAQLHRILSAFGSFFKHTS